MGSWVPAPGQVGVVRDALWGWPLGIGRLGQLKNSRLGRWFRLEPLDLLPTDYFSTHLGVYRPVLAALESLNRAVLTAMDTTKLVSDMAQRGSGGLSCCGSGMWKWRLGSSPAILLNDCALFSASHGFLICNEQLVGHGGLHLHSAFRMQRQ